MCVLQYLSLIESALRILGICFNCILLLGYYPFGGKVYCKKHIFGGYFSFGAIGGKNKNRQNMRPRNKVSNSVINEKNTLSRRKNRNNFSGNIVPRPLAGCIKEQTFDKTVL